MRNPDFIRDRKRGKAEPNKKPTRTEIINYLISILAREITYLEIGVRNPIRNFVHINADVKYSVDPGVEFEENPVDFQLTSDEFFTKLSNNEILSDDIKFDVIFIDGLHLAEQANRDIINSLKFIKDDGFIVLHDCTPPTEWHARETYYYHHTPAGEHWNGTTWKAFLKWRFNESVNSCCIDSDYGVGIISKNQLIGKNIVPDNLFFEYSLLDKNRKEYLNLMTFEEFKGLL